MDVLFYSSAEKQVPPFQLLAAIMAGGDHLKALIPSLKKATSTTHQHSTRTSDGLKIIQTVQALLLPTTTYELENGYLQKDTHFSQSRIKYLVSAG